MNHRLFHLAIASGVLSTTLFAQEPPRPTNPRDPQNPPATTQPGGRDTTTSGQQGQTASNDAVLTTWLRVDNENEIAIAKIGVQRAQSPEVRQFAQQMITDHGQMLQQLQSGAKPIGRADASSREGQRPMDASGSGNTNNPSGSGNNPSGNNPSGSNPAGNNPRGSEGNTSNATGNRGASGSAGNIPIGGGLDHEQLIRDLGAQCLQSSTKMLQEKQGAEFDKCFMGMQLAAHVKAVDTIEVFRKYASPELRRTLDEAHKTVTAHLEHAKSLVKNIEGGAAGHHDAGKTPGQNSGQTPPKPNR